MACALSENLRFFKKRTAQSERLKWTIDEELFLKILESKEIFRVNIGTFAEQNWTVEIRFKRIYLHTENSEKKVRKEELPYKIKLLFFLVRDYPEISITVEIENNFIDVFNYCEGLKALYIGSHLLKDLSEIYISFVFPKHRSSHKTIKYMEEDRPEDTDVTLVCADKVLKVKKSVLDQKDSSLVEKLKQKGSAIVQGTSLEIKVYNVSYEVLLTMIHYVYRGPIIMSDNDIVKRLMIADQIYELQTLSDSICLYFRHSFYVEKNNARVTLDLMDFWDIKFSVDLVRHIRSSENPSFDGKSNCFRKLLKLIRALNHVYRF